MTPVSVRFLHHGRRNRGYDNSSISQKISWSLLLWFVGITSFLLLVLIHSPSPFAHSPLLLLPGSNAEAGNACDLGVGRWVREADGSAYDNSTCRSMPDSNNCGKHGKDMGYLNWKWKPTGCELKRLDAGLFLRMVRGKTMTFVGDSVAGNQFESLLCLLSQVESPANLSEDRDGRSRIWLFSSHNFTLAILWTKFLVQAEERTINGPPSSGVFDLHVDKVDSAWTERISSTDIVVVSTGHWFFRKNYLYEGGRLLGCTLCSDPNITALPLSFSIGRALRTALGFVSGCESCGREGALLRTFSPAHFAGEAWDGGGRCNSTRPGEGGDVRVYWEVSRAQVGEMTRAARRAGGGRRRRFGSLDVTMAMAARADAHPGSHRNDGWMKGYDDCVHWCLPGPVDLWNDLLFAVMEKWRSEG